MVELSGSGHLAGGCSCDACFGSSTALLAYRLCGNREWSLRPPARTTHLQMHVGTPTE